MCISAPGVPTFVRASEVAGHRPSLVLWKALRASDDREHTSSRGMTYPIGQFIQDPNAVYGDHARCIHLLPTRDAAMALRRGLGRFEGHVVALLVPLGRVWTSPEWPAEDQAACWHTDRCLPIYCETCGDGTPLSQVVAPRTSSTTSAEAEALRDLVGSANGDAAVIDRLGKRIRVGMLTRPTWAHRESGPSISSPTSDSIEAFLASCARVAEHPPDEGQLTDPRCPQCSRACNDSTRPHCQYCGVYLRGRRALYEPPRLGSPGVTWPAATGVRPPARVGHDPTRTGTSPRGS
jgi:hypothetical protein